MIVERFVFKVARIFQLRKQYCLYIFISERFFYFASEKITYMWWWDIVLWNGDFFSYFSKEIKEYMCSCETWSFFMQSISVKLISCTCTYIQCRVKNMFDDILLKAKYPKNCRHVIRNQANVVPHVFSLFLKPHNCR